MHPKVAVVLSLVFSFLVSYNVNAMYLTESWFSDKCQDTRDLAVGTCVWGETRDRCNRRICAKGPGERCGDAGNILGICGEGMMCTADERCHGCSIQTLECFN